MRPTVLRDLFCSMGDKPQARLRSLLSYFLANRKRGGLETTILRSAKPQRICSQNFPSRSLRSETATGRIRED
jgi:hypothetical protein